MPDENYIKFDTWIMPILKQMLLEQNTQVCGKYSALREVLMQVIKHLLNIIIIAQIIPNFDNLKKLKE